MLDTVKSTLCALTHLTLDSFIDSFIKWVRLPYLFYRRENRGNKISKVIGLVSNHSQKDSVGTLGSSDCYKKTFINKSLSAVTSSNPHLCDLAFKTSVD